MSREKYYRDIDDVFVGDVGVTLSSLDRFSVVLGRCSEVLGLAPPVFKFSSEARPKSVTRSFRTFTRFTQISSSSPA